MPRAPSPHAPSDLTLSRPDWLAKAAQLNGKALHVGVALSWLAATYRRPAVPLTRRTLLHWHISRDACYDNLRVLEQAELIRVWRLPGRAPVVVLTEPGTSVPLSMVSCSRSESL
jgi:hypothetical protein